MIHFDQISAQIIAQDFFAYSDIEEINHLPITKNKNDIKYSKALKDLAEKYGNSKIWEVRKCIRFNYEYVIGFLGLYNTVSPFSKSITWILWDLGKQFFYFNNPDLSNSNYNLQDPCISLTKQQEILNRHLGWEVYHYDIENSVLKSLEKNLPEYAKIKSILQNSHRKSIPLTAYQYSDLGNLIIQSSGVGKIDCGFIERNEDYPEWAIKRKSKYMTERLEYAEKKMKKSLEKTIETIGNRQKEHFEKLPNSKEYIEEYGKITLNMCEVIKDKSISQFKQASSLESYFEELDKINARFRMTQEQDEFVMNQYFYDEWSTIFHFLSNEMNT